MAGGKDQNDPSDLQGREREGGVITPEEMDLLWQSRQRYNEQMRARAMNEPQTDPLSAALKMSFGSNGKNAGPFFPAAKTFGERDDLLQQIDSSIYGGGSAPPAPTPSPTPSAPKPARMTLAELYDHFGVENPVQVSRPTNSQPIYQNKPDQQIYDWRNDYGWSNA